MPKAMDLIQDSFLNDEQQESYQQLIAQRVHQFTNEL